MQGPEAGGIRGISRSGLHGEPSVDGLHAEMKIRTAQW